MNNRLLPLGVEILADFRQYKPKVQQSITSRESLETISSGSDMTTNIEDIAALTEGRVQDVLQTRHERNAEARRKCLAHYGTSCCACGLDFGSRYGEVVHGFIHVHHLHPLAETAQERVIDPIADLRPLCPNCHAVAHFRNPPYTIEEIKQMLCT